MTLANFFLILVNTLILVAGQFLWKLGLERTSGAFHSFQGIIKMMFSPLILTGIVSYGLATVLWLLILTRVPLSQAYPVQSMAYIIAVFGAYFVFGESLTLFKIAGCLLIMAGVSFIALSPK